MGPGGVGPRRMGADDPGVEGPKPTGVEEPRPTGPYGLTSPECKAISSGTKGSLLAPKLCTSFGDAGKKAAERFCFCRCDGEQGICSCCWAAIREFSDDERPVVTLSFEDCSLPLLLFRSCCWLAWIC